mmetsp:Transcript_44774/g.112872  ORF Transcript_44774/g.112872 Transcript_44774/m.112872 type:complete len:308 (-) Transcript_44774:86-1009(-)
MGAGALGVGLAVYQLNDLKKAQAYDTNWDEVRKEIAAVLDNENYDDGSYGPVLVRLAWHASGTYSTFSHDGGSNGATMRFCPESKHGANAGLAVARDLLEPIKRRHPEISYADLWTLAGCVAIEEMGGPKIHWRPGRTDAQTGDACPPDGRLPDASQGQDHVRAIFYRMGFSDREIVALVGAHALGRCHKDRSGYDGPWTRAPTTFSTEFFRELLENKWTLRKWDGPEQYTDPTGELMMLPADMAFVRDPNFKKFVEMYAADEDLWFADFAQAWTKLIELGVEFPEEQKKKCPLNLWAQLQHLLGKK